MNVFQLSLSLHYACVSPSREKELSDSLWGEFPWSHCGGNLRNQAQACPSQDLSLLKLSGNWQVRVRQSWAIRFDALW
jgi:hypothetical protein